MELPPLESRIRYSGSNGTVKYVGAVENAQGIWLGIEWDDPERGKHDGSKDGRRYFSCRSPRAGSFIRPSHNVQCGISFLQALSEKYIEQLHGAQTQEKVVLGSSQGVIQVEAVGLDKVRNKLSRLERLKVVSLDGTLVAYADPQGQIANTCSNIRALDLSFTLVSSWSIIAQIASDLPFLQRLSLNHNYMLPFEGNGSFSSSFANLIDLQLNGTHISWVEAHEIVSMMPSLRSLELGYNNLANLSLKTSVPHPSLETLNLDNNQLDDWTHAALSVSSMLPSLETLVLSSNQIMTIRSPSLDVPLLTVKNLSLSSNPLKLWSDLESLSQWCPELEYLSVQDIPLCVQPQFRSLVIARFARLTRLDGAMINERERRDAEMFYLTQLARQGTVSSSTAGARPFRWDELCQKHGPPQEESKAKDERLSSQLITISLGAAKYPPASGKTVEIVDQAPLSVLPTMVLRSLRSKIKKNVGKGRGKVSLWIQMRDNAWVELKQEDDANTLDWVGLENDSHIIYHIS